MTSAISSSGKTDRLARDMEREMNAAAAELDFERAARLRDNISALKRALEKQTVVFGDGTDADVVAFADDELEAAVQVFHVRGGRVRGQRGWIVEKSGDPQDSGEESSGRAVPHSVLRRPGRVGRRGRRVDQPGAASDPGAGVCRPTADELETWLCGLRGSRVALRVPMRGDKRALAETVKRNAQDALTQHKLKRAGDFTARSAALQSIQEALGLADAPLRIECVDISHVQGTDVVASLVVFEDGLPAQVRLPPLRDQGGGGWRPLR